ncbi:hypothetical protein M422DRAFT_52206 [Sphaerobolus stellatus SS14]|uniref:AMP-dependent synthetase/ligase domain-containing protein n=1 Tax=Sphaerobolus stellatus (strain SS14) TaxID=990650 RepID=A0A0C9V947_SPHS4|nr:hypothetical protein M422DRAFT_52206 [Sphaerobolus stellatus SS14]
MLKETSCHRLLITQETLKTLVSEIKEILLQDSYALEVTEMPQLFDIYPKLGHETPVDAFKEYPKASVRPDLDKTLLYLHSSESTGFLKSIRQSFRMICHWASFPTIRDVTQHLVGCMTLPAFHTLGLISQLLRSTYGLNVIVLYPPIALTPTQLPLTPTPDNIIDHLRRNKAESLISISALFHVWAQDEDTVNYLASLRTVGFSGGPLPSKLGKFLIDARFGGPIHPLRQPPGEDDWEYVIFHDGIKTHWEPQGDDTYECHFLTNANHSLPIENTINQRGYATSDLFVPHPTEPGFWKIVERKDDVIIHTSGEKTVPAPMENIISHSPYVKGVIIFGREHDQPRVLIELEDNYAIDTSIEGDVLKTRNALWPVVEESNKVPPAFSRVFKELTIFADPKKPLSRAGKGTEEGGVSRRN